MINISVIIPFYKGNKYLHELKKILEKACKRYAKKIEVILVNDSPDVIVDLKLIESDYYELIVMKHNRNQGIHQARVTGAKKARGTYLLFLDQDDKIGEYFFKEMAETLDEDRSADFAFCNGTFTDEDGKKKLILNSYGKVLAAKKCNAYFKVGNLLASPGQCLIRKNRIPEVWITNIMKTNCADDLFLWLLLLKHGKAIYVNKLLYEHINTGENTSRDKMKGYLSNIEVCDILETTNEFSIKKIRKFRNKYIKKYKLEIDNKFNHKIFYKTIDGECIARLNMKIIGRLLSLFGKKICDFQEIG